MAYATSQGTSPSISLLTYGTHDTSASGFWSAVSDDARERGINGTVSSVVLPMTNRCLWQCRRWYSTWSIAKTWLDW